MNLEYLKDFHRRRVKVLADSGADLIAFETVPNKIEAQVLAIWLFDILILISYRLNYNLGAKFIIINVWIQTTMAHWLSRSFN